MIFFFGTRANRIGQRRLNNTECSHCQTPNSFISVTFGRYVHFFWIPIFPIGKVTVAECSHCKKTYSEKEFTPDMKRSLERENEINSLKRPIWHGCGCLIIIGFVLFSLISGVIGYIFNKGEIDDSLNDERKEYLEVDKNRVTSKLTREKDSISYVIQQCVNFSIDGIDTEAIKYVSNLKDNKLMLILKVGDMKNIEKSSRKELVYAVEECLDAMEYNNITERYIAVDGNWNMLLVKTPYGSDLGGKFADEDLLLSFYDEEDEGLIINSNDRDKELIEETIIEIE